MSWTDFYRRRDALDAVIREAHRDGDDRLPFAEIPGAAEIFGSEEELALALQYKWSQLLAGALRARVAGPEEADAAPAGSDEVDGVTAAWRDTARRHPGLRRLLDTQLTRFPRGRRARAAELRMLAVTAGLAEPHEAPEHAARIGETLLTLAHEAAPARACRRGAVGTLLRRLAPAG